MPPLSQDEGSLSANRSPRILAAGRFTANQCASGQSNHSIISSMLAPASRFWKTMATGIRVPLKTQAPLTFPGMLSTAGHCDQSSAAMEGFSFRSFYTRAHSSGQVPKIEGQNAHPFKNQRRKGGAPSGVKLRVPHPPTSGGGVGPNFYWFNPLIR